MSKNGRKVCLVTGGAKGIGRDISLTMAEAGYDIAINYHNRPEEAKEVKSLVDAMGVEGFTVYGDMSDVESIRKMYDEVFEYFGEVHCVINNAGVGVEAYFLDTTEEMFDFMSSIDWKGLFFSCQEAVKRMIAANTKGCNIINISSNQSIGNWPRSTVYAPTKAAVEKFTKNCAMELCLMGNGGIRMNCVAPGYTDVGWAPDDHRWEAADRLPMRRFASKREIGKGCVYLASDDAGYITGQTLYIDGGALLPVACENDFIKPAKDQG